MQKITLENNVPFNGDKFIAVELAKLIVKHGIQHAVETGMWAAHTTRELRKMVKGQVLTLEPDFSHLKEEYGPDAVLELSALGIVVHRADSARHLSRVLPTLPDKAPVLFYLDAHGGGVDGADVNPLLPELEQIGACKAQRNKCVIAIHDFMVPGQHDWGCNWGDWGRGAEPLSFSVIEGHLPAIYPKGYGYHYNTQAEGCRRGIIYIYPKNAERGAGSAETVETKA